MSRTRKDVPYRVKAARVGDVDDVHHGCSHAAEHLRRRYPARWEERIEVIPARWYLRTDTVPHRIYGPLLAKTVTRWVFDEEVVIEDVPVYEDVDCETDPNSWCVPTIPWHLSNGARGRGLYRSRVSRAGDRDRLHAAARDYNTGHSIEDVDVPPAPAGCGRDCRRHSCWWCH